VANYVLAHRAEQCTDEAAVAARPDDKEVGDLGCLQERNGRMALDRF
jgi:hypothetical protein